MKQQDFLCVENKKYRKHYGGELLKTRIGRSIGRPLDTKNTIHLILRSSKAQGEWSFRRQKNEEKIKEIIGHFSQKYGVKIISLANVGNHLHFQIKLSNRHTYKAFIRAITSAIAMAITGASRWNPLRKKGEAISKETRFWDYRPFTRIVYGLRAFLNLRDYISVNQLEGFGCKRDQAKFVIAMTSISHSPSNSS